MFWKNNLYVVLVSMSVVVILLVLIMAPNKGTLQTFYEVDINTSRSVQRIDLKFLSVSFDNRLLQQHWINFNFSSSRIFNLARGLAPAFLRIGGTTEDWLIYVNKQTTEETEQLPDPGSNSIPHFQRDNFTEYNITSHDIDKIHVIARQAGWQVLFGLNVCLRTKDGTWNYSNPLEIVKYVASKGYNFGWELGNEPDLLGRFGKAIDPKTLGRDFVTLREILDKNPKYGKLMVGPDLTRPKNKSMEFLKEYLSEAVNAIDAITWHQYYFNSRTCKLEDFYDPEVLDYLLNQLRLLNSVLVKAAPNKRHWLGETSTAWGGGAYGMSNKFVATFTWMDKLGLAARLGAEIVVKQTFFHGNYALIDDDLNPTPSYWLSLLHKQLVGQVVLDVKNGLHEKRVLRVYAHCTDTKSWRYKKGAITVMALNVSPSKEAVLSLAGSLGDLGVDQYLLTPDQLHPDYLTSQIIRLNGLRLLMQEDDTLPTLHPISMGSGRHLLLPPLTLGFFVVPEANAKACLLEQ